MFIVKYRGWFFIFSGVLILGSVFALFRFGLNLSADFTGGSVLEVSYRSARPETEINPRPGIEQMRQEVAALNLGLASVQETGEGGYLLRLRPLAEEEHQQLLAALRKLAPAGSSLEEKRFNSVGPVLGQELVWKGIVSITVVVLLILFYIALVFRKVSSASGGVSSWVYGLVTIITMIHDVLIPTGVFALLGFYYGVDIDALFLTAFLTILGLSVNDKIVALDRIRENLLRRRAAENFTATVGRSLDETLTRSINTSLTVILVLLAIFFFGGASTKYFALAMAAGMIIATYSSIFIAAPLLVVWEKWQRQRVKV